MMGPDVVVIGGGPAGLAAAIVCATHGVRTALVERHSFPVDKPCGEGLLPNGISALGRIGLDAKSVTARGRAIAGIRYFTPKGKVAAAPFGSTPGVGVRRVDLADVLVTHARTLAALEMINDKASLIVDGTAQPLVQAGTKTWRPKLVIAADGLHSHARDEAGIVAEKHGHRWGCRQHFDVEPWTDHVEVYFERGFEIYITPVASGVNVAALWDASVVRIGAGCSPVVALVIRVPMVAKRLAGWMPTDPPRARGPFDVRVRRPWRDGVLLIGDAAGYLDAITGEGVGLALEQAALLAETVVPALHRAPSGAPLSSAVLEQFTRASRAQSRSHYRLTRALLHIARYPALVEVLIGALGSRPGLLARLIDVNMGRRVLSQ